MKNTISVEKLIKNESYFHDEWDISNLENSVLDTQDPSLINSLISDFNHYDLPKEAVVGGSWDLPEWYIQGNNSPEAPWWRFSFYEFTAYIKAVTPTNDPDIVEVEYYLYRQNKAHCSGYYAYWDNGKALVNISTHRRWNVA